MHMVVMGVIGDGERDPVGDGKGPRRFIIAEVDADAAVSCATGAVGTVFCAVFDSSNGVTISVASDTADDLL